MGGGYVFVVRLAKEHTFPAPDQGVEQKRWHVAFAIKTLAREHRQPTQPAVVTALQTRNNIPSESRGAES